MTEEESREEREQLILLCSCQTQVPQSIDLGLTDTLKIPARRPNAFHRRSPCLREADKSLNGWGFITNEGNIVCGPPALGLINHLSHI